PPRAPGAWRFPYTTLCRSFGRAKALKLNLKRSYFFDFSGKKLACGQVHSRQTEAFADLVYRREKVVAFSGEQSLVEMRPGAEDLDRKSTRLNSSHLGTSYA